MTTPSLPPTEEELLEYLAGTLPPDEAALMEQRLALHPAAREALDDWRRQDAAIRALHGPVAAEPVPDRLLAVIRKARADDDARQPTTRWRTVAALAGTLALGAAGGWLARGQLSGPAPNSAQELTQDLALGAIRAHETFVVETAYPVEVAASEAHLDTWLSNRLGRDTHSPDLALAGFTLMGGRVVPSEQGAAALYMYQDAAGRRITLYVARDAATLSDDLRFAQAGATRSFAWTDGDLGYVVAGDLPRDDLQRIAVAAHDQLT